MTDVKFYPIYITTGKRNRTPGATGPSRIRNVLISNVIADGVDANSGIQIMGLPEQPVEGIRLENIRLICNGGNTNANGRWPQELGAGYPEPQNLGVMPSYGLFARHVRGLELANVTTAFTREDARPAMICTDVQGLEIDNFKAQLGAGAPAAVWRSVTGLVVRNSPGLDGLKSN